MGSTNKTSLGLNQWVPGDFPAMEDFNADNSAINTALENTWTKKETLTDETAAAIGVGVITPNDAFRSLNEKITFPANQSISIGAETNKSPNATATVAFGSFAGLSMTTGVNGTFLGTSSFWQNTTGNENVGIGLNSGYSNIDGNKNTMIGTNAGRYKADGTAATDLSNVSGIGHNARASASNQVQLGDTTVTVYAQSAIQTRSARKDKSDIQDLTYDPLEFVLGLHSVQYRQNPRERYLTVTYISKKEYDLLEDKTGWSLSTDIDFLKEDEALDMSPDEILKWEQVNFYYEHTFNRPNDGSQAGNRLHNGFIADEVKSHADKMGFDFAGYQDHSINGGCDVQSLAYEQFIAPLIAAFQVYVKQTDAKIESLTARLEALEAK